MEQHFAKTASAAGFIPGQILGTPGSLAGNFLVAMPGMADERFHRAVIYLCAHTPENAMGLVINKPLQDLRFLDVLENLNITPSSSSCNAIHVHRGGPVETQRGFVLHSSDYNRDGTLMLNDSICLSATTEILKSIASGRGPQSNLMALGYSGWGPGQLDEEMKRNAWLNVPADPELLFSANVHSKWEMALAKLGISPALLSPVAGHC
jgi:putative transcriptional regulator